MLFAVARRQPILALAAIDVQLIHQLRNTPFDMAGAFFVEGGEEVFQRDLLRDAGSVINSDLIPKIRPGRFAVIKVIENLFQIGKRPNGGALSRSIS